jgi:hypothetical protein
LLDEQAPIPVAFTRFGAGPRRLTVSHKKDQQLSWSAKAKALSNRPGWKRQSHWHQSRDDERNRCSPGFRSHLSTRPLQLGPTFWNIAMRWPSLASAAQRPRFYPLLFLVLGKWAKRWVEKACCYLLYSYYWDATSRYRNSSTRQAAATLRASTVRG